MLRQKQNSYTPNNQYYIFQKSEKQSDWRMKGTPIGYMRNILNFIQKNKRFYLSIHHAL